MELIPLRADERPCLACGVAAVGPPLVVESWAMRGELVEIAGGDYGYSVPTVELTCCPACSQRREACVQLLADHPQLVTDGQALDRLAATADALEVLGQPVPATVASVRLHVRHLAAVGDPLRYVGLLVPSWREGVTPDVANAAPWGHLSDEQRHNLHEGLRPRPARACGSVGTAHLATATGTAGLPVLRGALRAHARRRGAWRGGPLAAADDVWRAVNTSTTALGAKRGGW